MSAVIGSIIGFLGSTVAPLTEYFTNKQNHKHELAKMEKQSELIEKGYTHEMAMFQQQANDKEHERLIQHDIAIQEQSGWIGALQRSVRPVITYSFFILFAIVEMTILYNAMKMNMPLNEAITVLWDENTQSIWAAVISFWFGNRAIEKARVRFTKR